jgi:adenosylhomocysteinase
MLLAGKNFVIVGYARCGKGDGGARGMAAQVIVTEVDPIRAIEAVLTAIASCRWPSAARIGDTVTLTGDDPRAAPEQF